MIQGLSVERSFCFSSMIMQYIVLIIASQSDLFDSILVVFNRLHFSVLDLVRVKLS